VTHEELRALLPGYAAGDLETGVADAVRMHLATGCSDCLSDLFGRPVGLPRTSPLPPVAPPPAPRLAAASPSRALPFALTVAGLALAALATWTIYDLRAREAARDAEARGVLARLSELEAARAVLAERAEGLEREAAAARAQVAAQTAATQAVEQARAALERDLATAQERIATLTRGIRRRDAEIDRLLGSPPRASRSADPLAATVELLRLEPVAPFRDGRGHVAWQPGATDVLLYAFGLPSPPGGGSYRVRATLDDGSTLAGPTFTPAHGDAVGLAVRLGVEGNRLRALDVVLEPAGTPVLAGRARGPTGEQSNVVR